jgi:hypothetical protein
LDTARAELEAARSLIASLDEYEARFQAMVGLKMDAEAYARLGPVLDDIRRAKLVIFNEVTAEAVQFLLAHSTLMSALWATQLAQVRGELAPASDGLARLHADHEEAIDRLRIACQYVVTSRSGRVRKPPAAPSAGL